MRHTTTVPGFLRIVLAVLGVLLSQACAAGNQSGTVNYVIVRASDGLVYFTINGAPKSGSPACATIPYWMIRDENSNAGKQQYAMLMTAKATGKPVLVSGSNTCLRWGDGEDVDWIEIFN